MSLSSALPLPTGGLAPAPRAPRAVERVAVAEPVRLPVDVTLMPPTAPSVFDPTPADPALAERKLVLAAQAGDAHAFAGLVRLHQRRAYAVARARGGNHPAGAESGPEV